MINLIEQAQGINLLSVSQTTKFILTQPFSTAINTIQHTKVWLRRRHPHGGTTLQIERNICIETALEHMYTIEYHSRSAHNTLTPGRYRHNFTQMNLKPQLRSKATQRIRRLFTISISAPPRVIFDNKHIC